MTPRASAKALLYDAINAERSYVFALLAYSDNALSPYYQKRLTEARKERNAARRKVLTLIERGMKK